MGGGCPYRVSRLVQGPACSARRKPESYTTSAGKHPASEPYATAARVRSPRPLKWAAQHGLPRPVVVRRLCPWPRPDERRPKDEDPFPLRNEPSPASSVGSVG